MMQRKQNRGDLIPLMLREGQETSNIKPDTVQMLKDGDFFKRLNQYSFMIYTVIGVNKKKKIEIYNHLLKRYNREKRDVER